MNKQYSNATLRSSTPHIGIIPSEIGRSPATKKSSSPLVASAPTGPQSRRDSRVTSDQLPTSDRLPSVNSHYQPAIASISQLVTISLNRAAQGAETNYTQLEAEQLRLDYLSLIESPDWKAKILELAKAIKVMSGLDGDSATKTNKNDYTLLYGGEIYSFPPDQTVITIGRNKGCDILLSQNDNSASRLNLVIFLFNETILIVDPGSFLGVRTEKRGTSGKPIVNSVPSRRALLQFDRDEFYILTIGQCQRLVGTPKTCVICTAMPREYRNDCGHFLMCRGCADRVIKGNNQCPMCRKAVSGPLAKIDKFQQIQQTFIALND